MPVIRVEGLRSFLWFPVVASFLSNRKEVQGWPGFTPGACGHGRRFSALKGQGGAIEEAMLLLAQGHQYLICTLHTHTHTHRPSHRLPHVCTHSCTENSPSASTKLLLWSPSLLAPIKNRQDKSITSPTRGRSSSLVFLPLIIHPCQAGAAISHGCAGRFSTSASGVRV